MELSPEDRKLFDAPNVAHLATLNPDGSPQVSPVWVDLEGDLIRINTRRGRVKERNVARDPRVAISITDAANPRLRVLVQGTVVEITEEAAEKHINDLSRKYDGTDFDGLGPGVVRIILKIRPRHVTRASD